MHRKDGLHVFRTDRTIEIQFREDGSADSRLKASASLTIAEWDALISDIASGPTKLRQPAEAPIASRPKRR